MNCNQEQSYSLRLVCACRGAFTLIEVVGVLGIVGVLFGLALGVGPGVVSRAARLRAETDLAALASALESYRRSMGDYPQTGGYPAAELNGNGVSLHSAEAKLYNALLGRLKPGLDPVRHRAFFDPGRFAIALGAQGPASSSSEEQAGALIDPWGQPYVYAYRASPSAPWKADAYLLYSRGPDGEDRPPVTGAYDFAEPSNQDNVHAHR